MNSASWGGAEPSGWVKVVNWPRTDFANSGWEFTAANPQVDPAAVIAATQGQRQSFMSPWVQNTLQVDETIVVVPEIVPAVVSVPETLDLGEKFALSRWTSPEQMNTSWIYPNLPVVNVFGPSIDQLSNSFRSTARPKRTRLDDLEPIYGPVPVFDPALWPATVIRGLMSPRVRVQADSGSVLVTTPTFNPALWPAIVGVIGERARARKEITDEWLTQLYWAFVPAQPFDPATWPGIAGVLGDRARSRPGLPASWLTTIGWPPQEPFVPPVVVSKAIYTTNLRRRRRY